MRELPVPGQQRRVVVTKSRSKELLVKALFFQQFSFLKNVSENY
jgi:hypothetical protein